MRAGQERAATARRPGEREFVLVAILVLFWGGVGLNRVGIGIIFPYIKPEFHLSNFEAAALVSGTSITWAFASWIGGWLSDRYGRRGVLIPAGLWICAVTALMGGAVGFWTMFIIRDLIGLGDGVGWSVGESTIAEESAPQRRGFNQSLYSAGYTLIGAGGGALIITHIAQSLGWRWAFPIIGGVMVFVVIALYFVMPPSKPAGARHETDLREAFALLRIPAIVRLSLMGIAVLTWIQVMISFNHLFLVEVRGFPKIEAGDIAAIWGFAGALGHVVLGPLSDFIGRRPVVLGATLVGAVALALYVSLGGDKLTMQFLLGVAGFCGFGITSLVLATCVSETVPESLRGSALGVTNFFAVILGATTAPLIAGKLADLFGEVTAMWIPVIAQLAIAALIMTIAETAPRIVARRSAMATAQ